MAESTAITEKILARYDRLIKTLEREGVERKGDTMPYTSVHGHMFSFLTSEGKLAMRMPEDEIADFIKRFGGRRCRQHGTVLKEYIEVADDLFKKTTTLAWYFGLSWMHAASMPPKKAKAAKKKPAAKKAAKKAGAAKKKAGAAKKKPAAKKAAKKKAGAKKKRAEKPI